MSDKAASPPTKRGGRKAAAEKSPVESKKRLLKQIKHVDSVDENDAAAPKRGRGRPPKGKVGKSDVGLRGRPKKDVKGKNSDDKEENSAKEEENH